MEPLEDLSDWEQFEALLSQVIDARIQAADPEILVNEARPAFHALTGESFADETGIERRDQAFFEWFVYEFERPESNGERPPLPDAIAGWGYGFAVGGIRVLGDTSIALRSWRDNAKLEFEVASTAGLTRNDAAIVRYIERDERLYASPATEVIHAALAKELKRQIKWLADESTSDFDMWCRAMRFQLVAKRYASASPREIVQRWMDLEAPDSQPAVGVGDDSQTDEP